MKIIGMISAMEEEVISLRRRIELKEIHQILGMDFYEGTMKGRQVIIAKCESGQINAALCTQILIERFGVAYIINTGLAGGLYPELSIGDLVLATDTSKDEETKDFVEANTSLLEYAKTAAHEVYKDYKVWVGQVDSRDQFGESIKVEQDPYTTFTAYCGDMENAAIAYTCYLNQIPFLVVRTVSDQVNSEKEINFEDFVNLSARHMSKMIENVIQCIR